MELWGCVGFRWGKKVGFEMVRHVRVLIDMRGDLDYGGVVMGGVLGDLF